MIDEAFQGRGLGKVALGVELENTVAIYFV